MSARTLKILRNERGNAMVETVPLLVIFVVLMSFGMGFFGIVHTAVLHSIAARTYSFETFRQRANLYYFREDGSGLRPGDSLNFTTKGWRYHAVQNEYDPQSKFVATLRPIALGRGTDDSRRPATVDQTEQTHNTTLYGIQPRNQSVQVNPVWVMVGYGICLNAPCGN